MVAWRYSTLPLASVCVQSIFLVAAFAGIGSKYATTKAATVFTKFPRIMTYNARAQPPPARAAE